MSMLESFFYRGNTSTGARVKQYEAGEKYKTNDLIASTDKTMLYIALQDFTASGDEVNDINNGYMQVISTATSGGYKRKLIPNAIAGNDYIITLEKQNLNYDRHIFVLKLASSNTIVNSSIPPNTLTWNKSYSIVVDDTGLYLPTTVYPSSATENTYLYVTINPNDYQEIYEIDIVG